MLQRFTSIANWISSLVERDGEKRMIGCQWYIGLQYTWQHAPNLRLLQWRNKPSQLKISEHWATSEPTTCPKQVLSPNELYILRQLGWIKLPTQIAKHLSCMNSTKRLDYKHWNSTCKPYDLNIVAWSMTYSQSIWQIDMPAALTPTSDTAALPAPGHTTGRSTLQLRS